MKITTIVFVFTATSMATMIILFLAGTVAAQQFAIPSYSIDGGGGVSSGGNFEMRGIIGQHDAGPELSGGNFTLAGGFLAGDNADEILLGDVNLDGAVNLLDVDPFIDRLSTGTFQAEADINQDGQVNLLDVGPFIELLAGG